MKVYEYRHVVGFEETNLVGNVYYINHLRWQGRCRELFLRPCTGEPQRAGAQSLPRYGALLLRLPGRTRSIRPSRDPQRLGPVVQNRLTLLFEYWRDGGGEELVARGEQVVACMRREGDHVVPAPIPPSLREALKPYA